MAMRREDFVARGLPYLPREESGGYDFGSLSREQLLGFPDPGEEYDSLLTGARQAGLNRPEMINGQPYFEMMDVGGQLQTPYGGQFLPGAEQQAQTINGKRYVPAGQIGSLVKQRGPGLFDFLPQALILGAGGALASGALGGGSIFSGLGEGATGALGAAEAGAEGFTGLGGAGGSGLAGGVPGYAAAPVALGTGAAGTEAAAGTPLSSLVTPALQAPAPVVDLSTQAGAADISRILGPAAATGAAGAAGKAGAATGGTALSRLLGLGQTGSDMLSVLGGIAPAALGAYGSSKQADAYKDVANEQKGLGQPYRDLLLGSYQPGFSLSKEPGFQDAIDQASQSFLRQASAGRAPGVSGGNPMVNPQAWAETQKHVLSNVSLPYLAAYRNQLGSAGGLGLPGAQQASMAGVGAGGDFYNAIGYGLGGALNPRPDYSKMIFDAIQGLKR